MSSPTADHPKRRLLFVVNVGWFFVSHRLPLAVAARERGYEVHVAAGIDERLDQNTRELLAAQGIQLHVLRLSRSSAHPGELCSVIYDLVRLYRTLRPAIIHLVTLKPLLMGGIAAKLSRFSSVVFAVPGRGSVFSKRGILPAIRRWCVVSLYRLAYRPLSNRVIVQNIEDRDYFAARGIFPVGDIRLIRGSGVDPTKFAAMADPGGEAMVILASRMLKEKGVADFVAAAERLKGQGVRARFVLVGEPDDGNPHSHTTQELQAWVRGGSVEWWGFRADMSTVFAMCHVVCLPTYYGEGVPKVLIEAAAAGRPIVTTDTPGCRDIVKQDCNGYLVAPRDVNALASALLKLIGDRALRMIMGRQGRLRVETEFSLEEVVRQTLNIYGEFAE